MPLPWKVGVGAFAILVGMICGPLIQQWLANRQPWEPGAGEVATTRKAIETAGDLLRGFDRKGDVQGAVGMLDTATYLLRNIDASPFQSKAMQNCKLAAAHLADGVLSVSQGGTWLAKTRFENALTDCK